MIHKDYVPLKDIGPLTSMKLENADGSDLAPLGTLVMKISVDGIQTDHRFVVVDRLSVPIILGCDFLTRHGVVIDFDHCTFNCSKNPKVCGKLMLSATNSCMLVIDSDLPQAIPSKTNMSETDPNMPTDYHPLLESALQEHRAMFRKKLGHTSVAEHVIETGDSVPVKVPARPIPFHFKEHVHTQLQEMADAGIIQPSNSPWCAPAVYVPKANGEVRICVDFVQLNKVTKKDSYPVPRADGPQQKLADKKVFSKRDLKSAYWQFPVHKDSIEKTAFSPGPGYGLWEFTVMPYGLTGATQTCQRGLDEVLRDCKDCVDNYVDDCIIFSDDMASHVTDLSRVLGKLMAAGFTLRSSKCFFGKSSVLHLGYKYSNDGVSSKPRQFWNGPFLSAQKMSDHFLV